MEFFCILGVAFIFLIVIYLSSVLPSNMKKKFSLDGEEEHCFEYGESEEYELESIYKSKAILSDAEASLLTCSGICYECKVTYIDFVDREDYIENVTPITFYCESKTGIIYKCIVLYDEVRGICEGYSVDVYVDSNDSRRCYVECKSLRE